MDLPTIRMLGEYAKEYERILFCLNPTQKIDNISVSFGEDEHGDNQYTFIESRELCKEILEKRKNHLESIFTTYGISWFGGVL